jgi:hypothetical protein
MAGTVNDVRTRLADIGEAADSSGVKVQGPVRRPSRTLTLTIAAVVCLPVLLVLLLRVHQHNERVACVKAFKRAGLTARLQLSPSRRLPGVINTPYFHYLFGDETAIVEINNVKDIDQLISSDASRSAPADALVFFDLTAAQRDSIWRRFHRVNAVRVGR